MRVLAAGAAYFAAVFGAGFALGVLRTLVLAPRLGEVGAVLVELPLILAFAWFACGRLRRRWPLPVREAALMGATAFGLLMTAEALLSVGLSGRSLTSHLASYAEPAHALGLAGQLVFAALPALRARRRA